MRQPLRKSELRTPDTINITDPHEYSMYNGMFLRRTRFKHIDPNRTLTQWLLIKHGTLHLCTSTSIRRSNRERNISVIDIDRKGKSGTGRRRFIFGYRFWRFSHCRDAVSDREIYRSILRVRCRCTFRIACRCRLLTMEVSWYDVTVFSRRY